MRPRRAVIVPRAALAAALLECACGKSPPPPAAVSTAPSTTARATPSGAADDGAGAVTPVVIAASAVDGPPLEAVAWSPGGRWLAAYCTLGCPATPDAKSAAPAPFHLLDRSDGRLRATLRMADRSQAGGASALFSPDDSFLATSQGGDLQRLFRVEDGKLLRELRLAAAYDSFSFSPDGSRAVFGSAFGDTTLLGLPRGEIVRAHVRPTHATSAETGFAWSPTGDRFVVTGSFGELRSGRTGARIADVPHEPASDALFLFGGGGKELLFATRAGLVERLRVEDGAVAEVLRKPREGEDCHLGVSRSGEQILLGTDAGIEVFDVASRSLRVLASKGSASGPPVASLDGRWIAELRTAEGPSARPTIHVFAASGAGAPASFGGGTVLGWTDAGEILAEDEGQIIAWSPAGEDVFRATFEAPVQAKAISPDGRFIAFADGQLVLLRASDHRPLRVAIAAEKDGLRLTPEPAEIAAFLRPAMAP